MSILLAATVKGCLIAIGKFLFWMWALFNSVIIAILYYHIAREYVKDFIRKRKEKKGQL